MRTQIIQTTKIFHIESRICPCCPLEAFPGIIPISAETNGPELGIGDDVGVSIFVILLSRSVFSVSPSPPPSPPTRSNPKSKEKKRFHCQLMGFTIYGSLQEGGYLGQNDSVERTNKLL